MFKRLLVPIVGNAASSVAVGFAIEIAQARGGEVTFVYALDAAELGMGIQIDPSWVELLRPDAEKVGRAALARATQAGCAATLRVVVGAAPQTVLGLASSFDLIVIGTRAIAGLAHVFEHSVTDAVVRQSASPVLVVREADTAPAVTSSLAIFRRFIVPIDGSPSSRAAIAVALTLATEQDEELVFVHALDRARATASSGPYAFDTGGAFEVMRRFGEELLNNVQESARAAGAKHVSTDLLDGEPLEAILKAIATTGADAVIVGTHGRQGLERTMYGSVTEDLIRRSPVPILTLHTPEGDGS
jgi:nucleotide-binding universal stress UspA family protein